MRPKGQGRATRYSIGKDFFTPKDSEPRPGQPRPDGQATSRRPAGLTTSPPPPINGSIRRVASQPLAGKTPRKARFVPNTRTLEAATAVEANPKTRPKRTFAAGRQTTFSRAANPDAQRVALRATPLDWGCRFGRGHQTQGGRCMERPCERHSVGTEDRQPMLKSRPRAVGTVMPLLRT